MAHGVKYDALWIPSLLFADDWVMLASSNSDLQLKLGRFAVKCETMRMRISTYKTKITYYRVLLTSERKMVCEIDKLGWCQQGC